MHATGLVHPVGAGDLWDYCWAQCIQQSWRWTSRCTPNPIITTLCAPVSDIYNVYGSRFRNQHVENDEEVLSQEFVKFHNAFLEESVFCAAIESCNISKTIMVSCQQPVPDVDEILRWSCDNFSKHCLCGEQLFYPWVWEGCKPLSFDGFLRWMGFCTRSNMKNCARFDPQNNAIVALPNFRK